MFPGRGGSGILGIIKTDMRVFFWDTFSVGNTGLFWGVGD